MGTITQVASVSFHSLDMCRRSLLVDQPCHRIISIPLFVYSEALITSHNMVLCVWDLTVQVLPLVVGVFLVVFKVHQDTFGHFCSQSKSLSSIGQAKPNKVVLCLKLLCCQNFKPSFLYYGGLILYRRSSLFLSFVLMFTMFFQPSLFVLVTIGKS